MSRSYRKHAYVTENQGDKCPRRFRAKTMANRMVRRSDDIPQNSAYRKIYDSWSICDWRFTLTEKEFRQQWENGDERLHRKFKSYKHAYRWWYTAFKRK
mgnify:CR=1 FL=1